MKIYNSRTRKVEGFKSVEPGVMKMYNCGPTAYDYMHIGNLRTALLADLVKKTFQFFDYKVVYTLNITDFGHLVGDGDSGDDKMTIGLKREGLERSLVGMNKLARKYTELYNQDIQKMNINLPTHQPFASDHIDEYISLIKKLQEKGFTYKISDGIYFDTSKDPNYGQMALLDRQDDKKKEARIHTNSEKKNTRDFCLWKFGDKKETSFESEFGMGFPGWHIECSGMARKFLGETFDIHLGGIDLMSVHHINEVAQSECAYEKTFCNFFMHGEMLNIKNEKMSKSKGNYLTLNSLIEVGNHPLAYRYFLLQTHYRKQCNFSWESLQASENAFLKLHKIILSLKHTNTRELNDNYLKDFKEKLEDDLNIPESLATLWKLVKDQTVSENAKHWTALEMDKIFSLDLGSEKYQGETSLQNDPKIQELLELRKKYRAEKNWSEADKIRDELKSLGVEVADK